MIIGFSTTATVSFVSLLITLSLMSIQSITTVLVLTLFTIFFITGIFSALSIEGFNAYRTWWVLMSLKFGKVDEYEYIYPGFALITLIKPPYKYKPIGKPLLSFSAYHVGGWRFWVYKNGLKGLWQSDVGAGDIHFVPFSHIEAVYPLNGHARGEGYLITTTELLYFWVFKNEVKETKDLLEILKEYFGKQWETILKKEVLDFATLIHHQWHPYTRYVLSTYNLKKLSQVRNLKIMNGGKR